MIKLDDFPKPILGQLTKDTVHLWHVSLAELVPYTPYLTTLLTRRELESYERARQFQKTPAQIASRALLRVLLASYLKVTPTALVMCYGAHGKPSLKDCPLLQFSVSHTKTDIIFALTQHDRVGVDMESLRPLSNHLDLAKRFFSTSEYQYLSGLSESDSQEAFIQLWTLKEAFVKAVGFGLSYPLSDFTIAFRDDRPYIVNKAKVKESSAADAWRCTIWQQAINNYLAVVVEGQPKTYCYDSLSMDLLCEKQGKTG